MSVISLCAPRYWLWTLRRQRELCNAVMCYCTGPWKWWNRSTLRLLPGFAWTVLYCLLESHIICRSSRRPPVWYRLRKCQAPLIFSYFSFALLDMTRPLLGTSYTTRELISVHDFVRETTYSQIEYQVACSFCNLSLSLNPWQKLESLT